MRVLIFILASYAMSPCIYDVTGRTHQIRAQLALEGWPLVGDPMYGGVMGRTVDPHDPSLQLRCYQLVVPWSEDAYDQPPPLVFDVPTRWGA
jgi:hypothetical protein